MKGMGFKMKNRLKQLREENGLTLDDMEKITGINRGTFNNYENGKTEPKLSTWKQLADFFEVSTTYLMGFSDTKKSPAAATVGDIENKSSTYNYITPKQFWKWAHGEQMLVKQLDVLIADTSVSQTDRLAEMFEQKEFIERSQRSDMFKMWEAQQNG